MKQTNKNYTNHNKTNKQNKITNVLNIKINSFRIILFYSSSTLFNADYLSN